MPTQDWAKPYNRILVTIDGSDFAEQALPHAKLMASATKAELFLLVVVPEAEALFEITAAATGVTHLLQTDHKAETTSEQKQQSLINGAWETLTPWVEMLHQEGLKAQGDVEVGKPADRILRYAKQNEIDLIMMSTHGRTGLAHLLLGSIAEKVLHTAHCPVMLLRPVTG